MSDYEGITGELRDAIKDAQRMLPLCEPVGASVQVRIRIDFLLEKLDVIDSIHAQLECENEALREQVDLMRPKDADGETWHIGDKAYSRLFPEFSPKTVCGFGFISDRPVLFYLGKSGYGNSPELHGGWDYADSVYRQPDTWERIIHDAMEVGRADVAVNVMPLINRCKALAGETE